MPGISAVSPPINLQFDIFQPLKMPLKIFLVLSKFIPTIYFGLFTGLAMLLAMISVLTLLPALILIFKPFGR